MSDALKHAIGAYRTAATTVHPLVAVVKLFDEALRRIGLAIDGTENRRHEEAYINISRASLILRGLAANLRFDVGGAEGSALAATLKQTYVTNMIALHTSYGKKDAPARYMRIRRGLLDLRNAWAVTAGMAEISIEERPAPKK